MAEPITVNINGLNSPIATVKIQNKLAESAVTSVAGRVGDVILTNADVAGVENVNNTSDLNKPISTATQAAIDAIDVSSYSQIGHKHFLADISGAGTAAASNVGDFAAASHGHLIADITGLGTAAASNIGDFATSSQGNLADSALQSVVAGANISIDNTDPQNPIISGSVGGGNVASVNTQTGVVVLDADDISDTSTTNKFTTQIEINKLASIVSGAEVNVNADWNSVGGDSQILNKPAFGDITGSSTGDFALSSHTHIVSEITDLNTGAFSITGHTHLVSEITDLNTGVFSTTGHVHVVADITNAGTMISANTGDYQLISQKGSANGYAGLDGGGKVPSAQLPSYVDDIEEYDDFASFPVVGESGKIYLADDTGKIYRWATSQYIEISSDAGAPVLSVNSLTGAVVLDPDDLIDTSTTNKFTTASDISKLSGIASGAEANVNADWNATSGDAEILNKPTIGTIASFDSGDYSLTGHSHIVSDITNLNTGDFALASHEHLFADVSGLGTAAAENVGYFALASHLHSIIQIIGLGTAAEYDVPEDGDAGLTEVVLGDDTRLTDSRSPTNHASDHTDGTDDIQDATTGQKGLATIVQIQQLEDLVNNNSLYVASGDNVSDLANDALYVASGDNVSDLVNDALYITSGDINTISNLNNVVTDATLIDTNDSRLSDRRLPIFTYRSETGNYTVAATDYTVNCISGNQTITMLDATTVSGQIFVVKNSSPSVITITGTSSQTFDGNASVETDFPQSLTLQSTNTNWIII